MVKARKGSGCSYGSENREEKKNEKFSVYDFGVDDQRVEKDSRKLLSKFKSKSTKFSSSPVEKYNFLISLAEGAKTRETCSRNVLIDIEDSNDSVEQMNYASDAAETSILSSPRASSCSPGTSSYFHEGKKPRRRISFDNQSLSVDSDDDQGNRNLLPISVDSDDECRIELRSSISAPYLARNKKEPSDHNFSVLDSEVVVSVKPDIIIFGEMYSTDATLTFSDRCIKVEGSTIGGLDNSFIFEWSVSDIVKIESSWYKEVETARVELYLRSGDETLAKNSEVIKLNFAICDPCWSERQEAIGSLDKIYKATWNTVTDSNKAFEGIIYPQWDPDAVSISMKDVQLLQPATFINDTIIDFYIKYLEQKLEPEKKARFHFFNSFFFRKLADYTATAFDGRAAFQRVCKWTRKVNLFEKDYLFLPVNFSLHWSLIIVCHPGEVAYYEDKEMEKPLRYPCILHLDSIKGSHRGLNNVFQSYLLEEWKERHDELSEDVSNKFLNLPFKSLELPQQENSFDCGLFLLYFVERFVEEAPINFSPHAAASKFLCKKWFPPTEASSRRSYIKNVLYRIINDSIQKDPSIINYCDFPQNEMEGGTGKELQQTLNGRYMGRYSTTNADKNVPITSREATNIRRLRYSGGFNLLPGDSLGQGDTGWSVAEGTYEHCGQLESVKRLHGILSPVEEEETKGKQTAALSSDKACSRFSEWRIIAPSMQDEYENKEMTSETVVRKFPISLEIEDDENFAPEKLLFSTSEERKGENEPLSVSSEELYFQVVEDSYESEKSGVSDNGNHPIHEIKGLSMSDQVVDSLLNADVKVHNLHPLT